MIADEFAFEGYPVSEVKNRYGLRPYRLELYEEKGILEIKGILSRRNGYADFEMVEQHLAYLESLAKKLNLILQGEEREGLLNLELRQRVGEIRSLCLELSRREEFLKLKNSI